MVHPAFRLPSVFASILDRERGGDCRFSADLRGESGATTRQLYLSGTAVLVNRYLAPGGVGEVADFMVPVEGTAPTTRHRLVRVARVVRGSLPFTFSCRPRFDYGRAPHVLDRTDDHAAVLRGPGTDLHVQVTTPAVLHADGDDLTAEFTLAAGEVAAVVRRTGLARRPPGPAEEQQGEISGLSWSVPNLGSSLGTAVAGTILVAGLTSGAYAAAMIALAVIGLVGLAAAVLLPRKPPPA